MIEVYSLKIVTKIVGFASYFKAVVQYLLKKFEVLVNLFNSGIKMYVLKIYIIIILKYFKIKNNQ